MNTSWQIKHKLTSKTQSEREKEVISVLLKNRGIQSDIQKEQFFSPPDPYTLTAEDVQIDPKALDTAIQRIELAIQKNESIIVYADYDADGVTAGAVLWETLYALGARVLPYVPHRQEEGYGLSTIGIDTVKADSAVDLIITVDHGITGKDKVAYARSLGIDVIVTDHHTKPDQLPDCPIVHTTVLSGSGVSWFVAKAILERNRSKVKKDIDTQDLLGIASIGTIADLLPLTGPNRSIVKYGLSALANTSKIGLLALFEEAGISEKVLTTYDISHIVAPRINALGRLEHAMDALRLLCTTNEERALSLASRLSSVNKDRQEITMESSIHAKERVLSTGFHLSKNILIIADPSYNPGIIGLIAGKLVEEYYLPSIVLSKGAEVSKASARSIYGFNIVEAIKAQKDLLVDVGGHPMAAGFTIETVKLERFIERMEAYSQEHITSDMKKRILSIECEYAISDLSLSLYESIQQFSPFGMANPEPVFADKHVRILDVRTVGAEKKHLKVKVKGEHGGVYSGIAFHKGDLSKVLDIADIVDIAYTLSLNAWNGKESLELKIKDIKKV